MDRLSIRIPPGTAHVASVRAFVGAVGRSTGCSEEAVDDLRLVATEACAQAIEQETPPAVIEVRSMVDGAACSWRSSPATGSTEPRRDSTGPRDVRRAER